MNLISLDPNTRFNNQMYMNNHQRYIYQKHNDFFKNKFYSNNLCNTSPNEINDYLVDYSFFKKSFVYIITETVADYPYPYFTEKTWKAFMYKMPFMLAGSKNSLTQLRSFGFKTFSNFWDEGYDTLECAADRVDKIVENLKMLSMLSQTDIDNLHKEMLSILDYNQSHLKTFYQCHLDKISKELENL
jgi:hypothetical protein